MKSKVVFIIFVCLNSSLFSQSSLVANYNKIYIGRNFDISYHHQNNKFSYFGGVTVHINREPTPLSSIIRNAGLTRKFIEHFGIKLGAEYSFYTNQYADFGVYFSSQNALMSQKYRNYWFYDYLVENPQSEMDAIYSYSEIHFGPVLSSDNVFGVYLKANLSEKLFLTGRVGAGLMFWKNYSNEMILFAGKKPNQGYNLTSQFSLGLGYTFKNNNAHNRK